MKPTLASFRFPALAVVLAAGTGCSMIPVKLHTETHVQHMDGTVEHKSSDWEGTLDQLPEQLGKAGKDLGAVTAQMAKELTEVPPPGNVELKDLAPELAKYQGQRGADFLATAKDDAGKPISFSYVRLGVQEYDEFFKTASEIYALVYQTTQVVGQMRQTTSKLLDTKIDANAELKGAVDRALKVEGDVTATARLESMVDMAKTLSILVPHIGRKIGKLVSTGEALVTSAPTSLTNPKIVAHLDLVKDGLVRSVTVIKESGGLIVNFGKDLTGFKA